MMFDDVNSHSDFAFCIQLTFEGDFNKGTVYLIAGICMLGGWGKNQLSRKISFVL